MKRYLDKMTVESIRSVLFVQEGIYKRIENYFFFLIFLIFKHGVKGSHSEACSLKKCTLPYIYFVFICFISNFKIKKSG